MTRKQYLFLLGFHERLIQPINDKLSTYQSRKFPILRDPFDIELTNIISSLKITVTSHSSFRVEFTCKGDTVVATMKKDRQNNPRLEHSLWELLSFLDLACTKHPSTPLGHQLSQLRRGILSILQIIKPEVYGAFDIDLWWRF